MPNPVESVDHEASYPFGLFYFFEKSLRHAKIFEVSSTRTSSSQLRYAGGIPEPVVVGMLQDARV